MCPAAGCVMLQYNMQAAQHTKNAYHVRARKLCSGLRLRASRSRDGAQNQRRQEACGRAGDAFCCRNTPCPLPQHIAQP